MAGENTPSEARARGGWDTDSGHRDHAAGASKSRSAADVAARESDIRLVLPARAENVAVIRHVLGAFAQALGLPHTVTEDMRLAVTEACTNVVRHAYVDGEGSIDVVVRPRGAAVEVVVSDSGRGIGPSSDTTGPGLGLPLMAALTDSLAFERSPGAGSRVVMSFAPERATTTERAA